MGIKAFLGVVFNLKYKHETLRFFLILPGGYSFSLLGGYSFSKLCENQGTWPEFRAPIPPLRMDNGHVLGPFYS